MPIAVDSLIANEFAVELNGEEVSGVFRISGLTTYKLDADGQQVVTPFEVHKMVQRDPNTPFNRWLRETREGQSSGRDLTVLAVDDGVVTRRWTAKAARIQEVSYSDFDSGSFEMIAEILTISYENIVEEWPLA